MGFEHITLESLGDVARLTINRPGKLNAIATRTRSEMIQAFGRLGVDPRIRCVILTGAGGRAFSAGEDLNEVAKLSPSRAKTWSRQWGEFLADLMSLPQPIVTSCPGYAVGAGWQIFLLGDYRISSEGAKFSMPEVDVGLPSIMGGAVLMSLVGLGHLSRFTLLGETIGSKQALELDLVHEVVPRRELEVRTLEVAKKLAAKPPTAVRLQKAWNRKTLLEGYRRAIADAPSIYSLAFSSGEPQRGIKVFFKARKGN